MTRWIQVDDDPLSGFPCRLKEHRLRDNLTQLDLGVLSGLNSTVISHYERGVRRPSYENLIRIALALETTCTDLTGI